ncbi:helix-turn-helix domain-containing protein [Goodfellowiella coeruleoviolacea]|uniref:Uncharacterized protein n=1 Tax=Goodfellowiella coeruleoviolacea TaxID=334858 RepID=A0AAE3GFB6_9PSEU|nr:hypothetical protein [Goodfellowiella coeruleoviolacea]MCP2167201.1 hypothetical protein [Goodfellowiella coeruleoviolacea]
MPRKEQVLRLVAAGHSYQEAGAELGVPPGLAYLIATGLPADGSDNGSGDQWRRAGLVQPHAQRLVNPHHVNPVRREDVLDWVRDRAAADPQLRHAARRRASAVAGVGPPIEPGD